MIESIHIVRCDYCGKELMRKYGSMPTQSEVREAGGIWHNAEIYCNECFQRSDYNTKCLKQMDKELAEAILSEDGKRKWCEAHNETGNVYRVKDGKITYVDAQGIWK